jgi:hypothetical protein
MRACTVQKQYSNLAKLSRSLIGQQRPRHFSRAAKGCYRIRLDPTQPGTLVVASLAAAAGSEPSTTHSVCCWCFCMQASAHWSEVRSVPLNALGSGLWSVRVGICAYKSQSLHALLRYTFGTISMLASSMQTGCGAVHDARHCTRWRAGFGVRG